MMLVSRDSEAPRLISREIILEVGLLLSFQPLTHEQKYDRYSLAADQSATK